MAITLGENGSANQLRSDLASTASTALGDGLIGVKSALTGGVARTQHDKNADTVSVKDFGAKGDGTTDDSAAFTAALAAVYGNSGTSGTVIVPWTSTGYKISNVTVSGPIKVQGMGNKSGVVIKPYLSTGACFIATSPFAEFHGLNFTGPGYGPSTTVNAVQVNSYLVSFEDCYFQSFNVGINCTLATTSSEFYVSRCRFAINNYGIKSTGNSVNGVIADCTFSLCYNGLYFSDDGTIPNATEGIRVDNCAFYQCGDLSNVLGGSYAAIEFIGTDYNYIKNCMIDLSKQTAVRITNALGCAVTGSWLSSSQSVNQPALSIKGDCTGLIVSDCQLSSYTQSWGAKVEYLSAAYGKGATFSNCNFFSNQTASGDCIVDGWQNVIFQGCSFTTASAVGVYVHSSGGSGSPSAFLNGCYIASTTTLLRDAGTLTCSNNQGRPSFANGITTITAGTTSVAVPINLYAWGGSGGVVGTANFAYAGTGGVVAVGASATASTLTLTIQTAAPTGGTVVSYQAMVY